MFSRIQIISPDRMLVTASGESLRLQIASLWRDMDLYERLFSTWRAGSRARERQAEARFHLIEAQLVRLGGGDRIEAAAGFLAPAAPVLLPIAAYRPHDIRFAL